MPTLDWIGKKAVLNHHREVPCRLLRCDSKEKRAIGDLWADRSVGQCVFVMPKGPDWSNIDTVVRTSR